jgi:uncharacterized protein
MTFSTDDTLNDFFKAISNQDLNQIRELAYQGFDVSQYDSSGSITPLSYAIEKNQINIVEALLDLGADPNQLCCDDQYTPLTLAIERNNLEIVNLLLFKGADPNAGGVDGSSLEIATRDGKVDFVIALLSAGASVDPESSLPDFFQSINQEVPENLVNATWTPLMSAATYGHLEIVEILVAAGANVDIQDEDHQTALVKAARQGNRKIFNYLFPLTTNSEQKSLAENEMQKTLLSTPLIEQ